MYQQLWGYKVEEKLYLGVREQKRLITTDINDPTLSSWREREEEVDGGCETLHLKWGGGGGRAMFTAMKVPSLE
jgi:hypothetical protein